MARLRISLFCLALVLSGSALRADQAVAIGTNQSTPAALAGNAHVGWARTGAYWKDIETTQGVYTFSGADYLVDTARSAGEQVLFVLSGVPGWAGGGAQGNFPPADITLWTNYVTAVVQHYAGRANRPVAYEIWNEPDISSSSTYGVGWSRNIDSPPLYVDYFVAAARIIRSSGALAVGPALSGGYQDRTRKIFLQLENTWYADGNASDFVDAISAHANACCDDTHSDDAANLLRVNKLTYLSSYNPRNRYKPIWVTEFGWKSGAIGQDSQRIRINNFLIYMTGYDWYLDPWSIDHAFIYKLKDDCPPAATSRGIYTCSETPKQVVTQYLQLLPAPATQQPGYTPLSAQLISMSVEDETEPAPLLHESRRPQRGLVEAEDDATGRSRPSPCDQLTQRHGYQPEQGDRDCQSFLEYQQEEDQN
jgi:hypothetical protein